MSNFFRPGHIGDLERASERGAGGRQTDQTIRYVIIGGSILLVILTFWFAMQIASVLSMHWIPVGAGLVAAPKGLITLIQHLSSPEKGYPKDIHNLIAPGWLFLPVFALIIYLEVRYGRRLWTWWQNRRHPDRGDTGWAEEHHLSKISDSRGRRGTKKGVILGKTEKGKFVRLEPKSHALVVAGTQSGKTAGLCIPSLLTFQGTVIATSVKNDLVENTIAYRKQIGQVLVFDPVEATGFPASDIAGWSPLESSRTWRGAQRTASSLIEVAMSKKSSGGSGNMEFFKRMSQQSLPVLLYAAAVMDEDMRRVVRWLHRITDQTTSTEIQAIMEWVNNSRAMDAWVGFITKEPKIRGDIAATIASALVSYEDEKVEQNATHCDIKPEDFFNGQSNTLYICAPMAEQARLEPVFVALIQSLLLWITEQPQPLKTPLLVVLDEAANIAALPLLPELLSTIASYNVQIITSWQDFSQIKSRYGDQYHTILNNSRGKLVLPGVADPETIQYFSQVTGETIEKQVSVSRSDRHSRQLSYGEGRRSLLTPATIRQQKFGEAILVYGHLPPAKIKLRLWFKDRQLQALAKGETPIPDRAQALKERLLAFGRRLLTTLITRKKIRENDLRFESDNNGPREDLSLDLNAQREEVRRLVQEADEDEYEDVLKPQAPVFVKTDDSPRNNDYFSNDEDEDEDEPQAPVFVAQPPTE